MDNIECAEYSTISKMFGKKVEIVLNNINPVMGKAIAESAYQEGLRLEKIFNIFESSSELNKLNKKRNLKVSNELLEVIKEGIKFSEITDGELDISLGKLFLARKRKEKEPKLDCSFRDIAIDGNMVSLKHPDALIDLGSIAKGYIADKMVVFLKKEGVLSGLIDARGDIAIFGEEERILNIQHPRENNKFIKSIKAKNCGIATSGDYHQYYGSFDKNHIINNKEIISVTVAAPELMTADAYATAIFVCTKEKREMLLKNNRKIRVLTIDKDMKLKYYNNFEDMITDIEN